MTQLAVKVEDDIAIDKIGNFQHIQGAADVTANICDHIGEAGIRIADSCTFKYDWPRLPWNPISLQTNIAAAFDRNHITRHATKTATGTTNEITRGEIGAACGDFKSGSLGRRSTSRSCVAPIRSSAQVSLESTYAPSLRPIESGLNPCGSRAAINASSVNKTMLYAPFTREIASMKRSSICRSRERASR